ncbi:MAG: AsmA family protein [Deltaproteobacteria bacterium]|nr:AsmA family protein [Deltaproteobacteria bacterium]
MKKFFIIGAVLLGIVFVLLLFVPYFIDFDKQRENIVQIINQKISGRLETGKLSVSLWGGFNFKLDEVSIYAAKSKEALSIVSVPSLKGRVSILSFLFKSPKLFFVLEKPTIHIKRFKNQKINLVEALSLGTQEEDQKKTEDSKILGLLFNSKLSLSFINGELSFEDFYQNKNYNIKGFQLNVSNLGLGSTISYDLETFIQYQPYIEGSVQLGGKARLLLDTHLTFKKIELIDSTFVLTSSRIKIGRTFDKKADIPLKFRFSGDYSDKGLSIEKLHLNFYDLILQAQGRLQTDHLDFSFSTNKIDLSNWNSVSPFIGKYGLKGECFFNGSIKGTPKDPDYEAIFSIQNGEIGFSQIKPHMTQLITDFELKKDKLNLKKFSFQLGKSSLALTGDIHNFKNPVANLNLSSPMIHLKEIEFLNAQKKEGEALPIILNAAQAEPKKGFLDNFLKKLTARGSLKIDKLITQNYVVDNIDASLNYSHESLSLQNLSFSSMNGSFKAQAQARDVFHSKPLIFSGKVQKLDVNKLFTSFSKETKDNLFGSLFADFNLRTRGLRKKEVLSNLNGSGHMTILEGSFSTLKIGEAIRENLKGNPLFANSPIFNQDFGEKFEKAEANFNVRNERINLTDLVVISPNYQFSARGEVYFNENLNLNGFIRFPADLVTNGELLADNAGKIRVPFSVQGTFQKPQVSVDVVTPLLEALASRKGKDLLKPLEDIFKGLPR